MKNLTQITKLLFITTLFSSSFAATLLDIGSGSATIDADMGGSIRKVGAGTIVLSGTNDGTGDITAPMSLDVNEGLIQTSKTASIGSSLVFSGGSLQITSGNVILPATTISSATLITTDGNATSQFSTGSGNEALTMGGDGIYIYGGDFSGSSSEVKTSGNCKLQAGKTDTASSTGTHTISSGGTLELIAATAKSIRGSVDIESGATLLVNNIHVPAKDKETSKKSEKSSSTTISDIFSNAIENKSTSSVTLKLSGGSRLKFIDGAKWSRSFLVDTPS